MKNSLRKSAFAAVAVAVVLAGGAAWSQDAMKVVQDRQALMKRQSKDLEAIKAYIDDKGDIAAARTAGGDLVTAVKTIPAAFPKDTGMAQFPGKSGAKPAIWTEWDKFSAGAATALAKAEALNTALQGTDKAAITAAFGDMGKNGCGGCHTPYREKI